MTADEAAEVMREAMQRCADDGWTFYCHWSESFWMDKGGEGSVMIQSDYAGSPVGLLHTERP